MQEYQPASKLGWIDFSDSSRQKVLSVLEALNGKGTIDELGIGSIRNAFSNELFPGTSTLMTRAKYFFFVPYILKDFLRDKKANDAKKYLYDQEKWLVEKLTDKYKDNLDGSGIIGYTIALANQNRRQQLLAAQPPSTIYWGSIRKFGIYQGSSSLTNYLQQLTELKKEKWTLEQIQDDISGIDDLGADDDRSMLSVPYSPTWRENLSMELNEEEQIFLKNKIIDQFPSSLISLILSDDSLAFFACETESITDLENHLKNRLQKFLDKNLLTQINKTLQTANRFWRVINGAHILYNLLLQEKIDGNNSLKNKFTEDWDDWIEEMKELDWENFDRKLLWEIVDQETKLNLQSRNFVNIWFDNCKNKNFDRNILDALVETQEKRIKGKRAKLHNVQDLRYDKRQGLAYMRFRFPNAQRIITDLTKTPANA